MSGGMARHIVYWFPPAPAGRRRRTRGTLAAPCIYAFFFFNGIYACDVGAICMPARMIILMYSTIGEVVLAQVASQEYNTSYVFSSKTPRVRGTHLGTAHASDHVTTYAPWGWSSLGFDLDLDLDHKCVGMLLQSALGSTTLSSICYLFCSETKTTLLSAVRSVADYARTSR